MSDALHDGAPVGQRTYEGREYSVFNALELFHASRYGTYELTLARRLRATWKRWRTSAAKPVWPTEDWSSSVRMLCKACSEGRPHEYHDSDAEDGTWRVTRRIALSFDSQIESVLDSWMDESRRVIAWDQTLAAGPA
jgi:hypothetical protein